MSSKTPFTTIRNGAAAVTLVAVAVLGLVAAESGGTVVRHTVVTKHETRVVNHTTAPKSSTPTQSAPVASSDPDVAPVSEAAAPAAPTASDPVTLASSTAATPAPATTPSAAATPTPTTTTIGSSLPTTTANAIPACPAGLAAPAQSGGLQSLIGFAPLFGPFSSEAFAMAPSFQPVLELIGPFLTAFANYYAPEAPTLAPLLNSVDSLETEGYSLLSPLFGPYQTQFLSAETKLAAALAPGASLLVDNPAASCVIDIEGLLTSASH